MTRVAVNIAVSDVRASSAWYQRLLNCSSPMDAEDAHRDLFDLLVNADGRAILILSKWGHNPLEALNTKLGARAGHGVVLFFSVPNFERSWDEAKTTNAKVVEAPHASRGFEVPEFTVLDLDGYTVTISKEVE